MRAAALEHRHRIQVAGGAYSGSGWDYLLARARSAQAFLLGEEHGIAENPRLAGALLAALVPAGYRTVAVEISPPMARELDRTVTAGGFGALRDLLANESARVAFFGLREELEWLAAARAAIPGRESFLWGLDYEVGADRHLIAALGGREPPAAARTALTRLAEASNRSWARYHATRDPSAMFSFGGDPALVRAVREAWTAPDAGTREILHTLEETLEINRLWMQGQGYASNVRRVRLLRSNLLTYWKAMPAAPRSRVFVKLGASHAMRGLTPTDVYDVGTLLPELIAADGGEAFHLLVLADPRSLTGNFDPFAYRYVPGRREQYQAGLEPFTAQVWPDAFTLFETAPLRAIARSGDRALHPELVRTIHGFDAVLVLSGSTPATDLYAAA